MIHVTVCSAVISVGVSVMILDHIPYIFYTIVKFTYIDCLLETTKPTV